LILQRQQQQPSPLTGRAYAIAPNDVVTTLARCVSTQPRPDVRQSAPVESVGQSSALCHRFV